MYTVIVYEDYANNIIIETASFNTLEEAFKYGDKYCIDYYTEINNIPYYCGDYYDDDYYIKEYSGPICLKEV